MNKFKVLSVSLLSVFTTISLIGCEVLVGETKFDETGHWTEYNNGSREDFASHNLTQNYDADGHWKTCDECGYSTEKEDHTLETKYDDTQHWSECDCGYSTEKVNHNLQTKYDDTKHWTGCDCGYAINEQNHTLTAKFDDTQHWSECDCGYTTTKVNHDFSVFVSRKTAPTCDADGVDIYKCSGCEKTKEVAVAATGHDYDTAWSKNDTKHWHACKHEGCTSVSAEAAHTFVEVSKTEATCTTDGKLVEECSVCGYQKESTITAKGHNFTKVTDTDGNSIYTCSGCGTVEVALAEVQTPTNLKAPSCGYYNMNSITVSVSKAGIYRFNLDYGYKYTGSLTNTLSVPMYNSTIKDVFYAAGHGGTSFDTVLQSWAYVSSDASVAFGYETTEEGGYNAEYWDMYLQEGTNVLKLVANTQITINLRGYKMQLIKAVDAYAHTSHFGKGWSSNYLSGKAAIPGFQFNVIQGSGQALTEKSTTVTLAAAGDYDLSYFAWTPHADHELKVTLTKGETSIAMTSKDLYNDDGNILKNATYGRMRYNTNLYNTADNKHIVTLDAGEWTVTVSDTVVDSNKMLFYGGGLFFTKTN